jgi:putative addiction module killer protein
MMGKNLDNMSFIAYNPNMEVKIYRDEQGNEPFTEWLESIKDRVTQARIRGRLRRIELGNLGDHRSVGGGVFELRLHFGPGYRIYYGQICDEIILLLVGGAKTTQRRDIRRAKHYWYDHERSHKDEGI